MLGLVVYVPGAHALKRAPFPNSTPLQPIPADVQPNISANVNSDVEQVQPLGQTTQNFPADDQSNATTTSWTTGLGLYFYLGIGAGILTVFLVRYFLKKRAIV